MTAASQPPTGLGRRPAAAPVLHHERPPSRIADDGGSAAAAARPHPGPAQPVTAAGRHRRQRAGVHARPRSTSAHRRRVGALVLATMCWGCDSAAAKYALHGFGPLTLLAVQLVIASALLWVVLTVRCHRRGSYALAAPRRVYALLGALEPGLAYGGLNYGLAWTSAVAGSLIGGLEASCTFALAALVLREPLTRRGLLAAAASGTGAVLVGLSTATGRAGLGDALVLAGVLAAAIATLVAAQQRADTDAIHMTVWQFTFGLAFVLPLLALQWASGAEAVPVNVSWREWLAAGIGGTVVLVIPFLLFNAVVTKVPATTSAMALNLYPVFGVIAAVLALAEQLTALDVAGGALIVAGITAFNRAQPA
jgi:drug/metabolite transporter (DMT)-like permease